MLEEFFHIRLAPPLFWLMMRRSRLPASSSWSERYMGPFAAFRCRTGMGIQLRHHRDFHTSGNHGAIGEVEAGTAVRGYGMEAIVFFQAIFEGFADQIFPVYHENGLGFLVKVVNPIQQTFLSA